MVEYLLAAKDCEGLSNIDDKHDALVERGVLDAYCALVSTKQSLKPLCSALKMSADDLKLILFRNPHSQNKILVSELVSLTYDSLKVLKAFGSQDFLDKEQMNAARHHKSLLDAAIIATRELNRVNALENADSSVIVNSIVQVGSNTPIPPPPKLIGDLIDVNPK